MPRSQRLVRPASRPALHLQPRDLEVLQYAAQFRQLTSEHLRLLAFGNTSSRFTNRRLRGLWAAGLLERRYLPEIQGGLVVRSRRPVYVLTRRGAEVLAEVHHHGREQASFADVPQTSAIRHDLIATDLMVAAVVAARGLRGLEVSAESEHSLRSKLARWRLRQGVGNRFPALVPDGALTLSTGDPPRRLSFPIEVVRAGVRAGNRTLRAKMERYVALNRNGFFRYSFAFEQLRAVLFVTTSPSRVENLRRLAENLPHGRNLFWFTSYFTSYERRAGLGMTFEPARLVEPVWRNARGELHALIPAAPSQAATGATSNPN